MREVDAFGGGVFDHETGAVGFAEDFEVWPACACGFEVATCGVASLAPVGSSASNGAESVVEADVISGPRIRGLLRHSGRFIAGSDNVVLDGEAEVIEACAYRPAGSMVFSDERHSAALSDGGIDWLQGLVLAHVMLDVLGGPGRVVCECSPIVEVLVGSADVPGGVRNGL